MRQALVALGLAASVAAVAGKPILVYPSGSTGYAVVRLVRD